MKQKDTLKTSIAISLLLHFMFLTAALHAQVKKPSEPPKPQEQSEKGGAATLEIIPPEELTLPADKAVPAPKKGYYGIGVYLSTFHDVAYCDGTSMPGWTVSLAVEGYPAELSGMLPGDIIIEVNGKEPGEHNDIIGIDESPVTIVICRNGLKQTITMKRQFIRERN